MKKSILSGVFLSLVLLICGIFYGCSGRYDNLSMQASFSYSLDNAELLENDVVRVSTSGGVFDDNNDGTYTFYINESSTISANIAIEFDGVPEDFNYNASINFTNNIGKTNGQRRYTSNGFVENITFFNKGQTVLEVLSAEGNKKVSLICNVVQIAKNMSFKTTNYALTKTDGSFISLDRNSALQIDGSVVNIKYEFGEVKNEVFEAFDYATFWGYGLEFDSLENKLIVKDSTRLAIDNFIIKATYENPLNINEPLIAYTSVSIVNQIEKDSFKIYLGKTYADVKNATPIALEDVQNLIVNIASLNYVDIVLKAKTNGEEASFGFVEFNNMPIEILGVGEQDNIFYENSSLANCDDVEDAVYTFQHLRIVANKKTTDDNRYPNNGKYNLQLTCYYKNYTVEGYPIFSQITLKNDILVKNFSVNDQVAENIGVTDNALEKHAKEVKVYINSHSSLLGSSVKVSVAEPMAISNQNSRFTLKLFDENFLQIVDASSLFKIYKSVGVSTEKIPVVGSLSEVFEKNTTFYINANENSGLEIGDVLYLQIEAEKPANEELRAKAVVKLSIVQGIQSVEEFTYYSRNFVRDADGNYQTVEGAIYDKTTDLYYVLTDSKLADTESNRTYLETNKVLSNSDFSEKIKFDSSTYIAESQITLDLTSTFDTNFSFAYLPSVYGVDISNVKVYSSKPSVFSIGTYTDETGNKITTKNYFSIIPHSVGEAEVLITASNLTQTYKISVKIYKPITSFNVKLSSNLFSYGIGDYVNDANGDNTLSAIVKVGKNIKLNLTTLPLNATEYILDYKLYDLGEKSYSVATDLLNITIPENIEDNLIGSYTIDYDKNNTSGEISVIGNDDFQFNCKTNIFNFPRNESSSKVYYVTITLTNLDNSIFTQSILLASYVPVESIDTSVTSSTLINPNTLYYRSKTGDASDPSAFGIKIEINKSSAVNATFDFAKTGEIEVLFNGNSETFKVENGFIAANNNKILVPISPSSDQNGYYWFKLNDNYSYQVSNGVIFLNVKIKEFDYILSKPVSVYVYSATLVNSLLTESSESVYFKQGITPAKNINITVANENAYNKELLIKVFDIVKVGPEDNNQEFYVETTNINSILKAIDLYAKDPINYERVNKTTIKTTFDANKAGRSVVVVMPQDKVISKVHFDTWNNKQYVPVDLTSEDYITNFYYTFDNSQFTLATGEFDANTTYYIYCSNVSLFVNLWRDYLKFDIAVADGIIEPYQVSNFDDLKQISDSDQTVLKRYVLTNNITLDSSESWQPIGNYYEIDFSKEDENGNKLYVYEQNVYYTYNASSGTYSLDQSNYSSDKTYYSFGFNGEINGMYSFRDIKENVIKDKYFTISNLFYAGNYTNSCYGFVSNVGVNGKLQNLTIKYNYFQPIIMGENFVFGGLTGTNQGQILNSQVYFNNLAFSTTSNISFGGLVGKNYGTVSNKDALNIQNFEGIKGEVKLTLNSLHKDKNLVAHIGGIVGENYGELIGTFDVGGEIVPTFNDSGFDSGVNISVLKHAQSEDAFETSIGGAIGYNEGLISNICIQGNIKASSFDNVGGLVGTAGYKEIYNNVADQKYSVLNSYSIAKVAGNNNVGGAIGYIAGASNKLVTIYNISAENYSSLYNNQKRTFVKAENNAGGLIGKAEYADIKYSYAVSYYDGFNFEDNNIAVVLREQSNFDVVANSSSAGGFIGFASNLTLSNCASSVYVLSNVSTGIFVASNGKNVKAENVFAIGFVQNNGDSLVKDLNVTVDQTVNTFDNFAYCAYNTYEPSNGGLITNCYVYENGTAVEKDDEAGIAETFEILNTNENIWATDSKTNGGLPYLTLNGLALFATTPIEVYANVLDGDENQKAYIKFSDNSLVLFYNYDYLKNYEDYIDLIEALNMFNLSQLAEISVFAKTYKSYKLDLTTSNSNVISIDSNGLLKIVGLGNAVITVSSKLNSNYKAEILVVVTYGISDIDVYSNISLTHELKDNTELKILKNKTLALYDEEEYVRRLGEETNPNAIEASLQYNSNVGLRFKVEGFVDKNDNFDIDLDKFLKDIDEASNLDDVFTFNNISWLFDDINNYYYVDVPAGSIPIINPNIAFDGLVTISYIPYINIMFGTTPTQILLEEYSETFMFSIKKGATKFVLENNLDNIIAISQLQTQSFTLTLYTDYEDERFKEEFNEIDYITYTENNLLNIIESGNVINNNINDYLSIVRSDVNYKYEGSLLESISITYTVSYKDKINAVEKDRIFRFNFTAESNITVSQTIGFVILGQDKISQVYGTIYSNLLDYPQTPEKNNIIYNGTVGVLSLEVYPFLSNYTKMRVYYESNVNYPLFITQLSYDITGESGKKLDNYPDSGSVNDFNQYLWIEKSSGQDTYLFNETGTYSYSKTYFISMLVATEVPDKTEYTIYVDFLNRSNDVVKTYQQSFTTVAQPAIKFSFDEKLKGNDERYYLPLNTTNKLNVSLNNYEGDIEWEVSCNSYQLNQNLIDVLTPYLDTDGNYYFRVMKYDSENSSFTADLLGHTLKIKGMIEDGRNAPKYGQNYFEIQVVVTLFTVLDVTVKDVANGYLSAIVSSTTPLYTYVNAYYDNSLTTSEDNWYKDLMNGAQAQKDRFVASIKACGYEVEDNFINYITQLQNSISKASYNPAVNNSTIKTSGVWYYNSSEQAMSSGFLQSNKQYNGGVFGVEMSNGYFSVYGNEIDINSSLSLKLELSYNNGKDAITAVSGIPNVYGYNVSSTNINYQPVFKFNKDFILTFVYKSDLINAIPISTAEEFLQMQEGLDYRLINDIELALYTPISTPISTFDGNNYTIYITSFNYSADYSENAVLGLFDTIAESTILYNVKVHYTNRVENVNNRLKSIENGLLNINFNNAKSVSFGGIATTNNGTLTNCLVSGGLTVFTDTDVEGGITTSIFGGITSNNTQTGYITNSKVQNFRLTCYGYSEIGGVVVTNDGKIVSTSFNLSSIKNTTGSVGGFVNVNNGEIYECLVQGNRSAGDTDIRNKDKGIVSDGGIIGGFVYSNAGVISDCYTNIKLSSGEYLAGFVYTDTQSSNISRCYSICHKSETDSSTIASPFAGTSDRTYKIININGQLNNCYYLSGTGNYNESELKWANDDKENKKATGLTLDEFATYTKFTSYDLSLVYETGYYADGSSYYFVDGYTWVIIEGKPELVSTQINTISQRDYEGKSKIYSDTYKIFDISKFDLSKGDIYEVVVSSISDKKEKKYYYDATGLNSKPEAAVSERLIYSSVLDMSDDENYTLTYTFEPTVINDVTGEKSETLTIVYNNVKLNNNVITQKTLISCEYGKESKKILDAKEESLTSNQYITDSNFRANDTLEINYNDKGEIESLQYCVLESASYYYREASDGISFAVGTRTNPQIIYDRESFNYYLSKGTLCNYYRIIKDIDFNYGFTKTSYSNFQGSLQGNYMNLDKISISYQKDSGDLGIDTTLDAFGLFAKISTIGTQNYTGFKTTNISNLRLNIVEVLSNSHMYVGALAGQIRAENNGDNQIKVVLNNISVAGYDGSRAFIQGKNAVGGLAGYATRAVIIKDISTSVSVNATKEMDAGYNSGTLLYVHPTNNNESEITAQNKGIAYTGGVIGVFDADAIVDPSTGKNYNANNIVVSGDLSIIGGITGSAFGLVGENTVVNYVNTVVNSTSKTFMKAIVYAGGLVGENRGIIYSSSITYSSENYSNVKPGESTFTTNDYFYNGSEKQTVVAIGGLIGFNNGGEVYHSYSSINVKNKNATIAGGAVGRMVEGTLKNVASYGAVTAKMIVGGLIGTLNNLDIIKNNSNYNKSAIIQRSGANIINCVAATNWLVSDYTYYMHLLSTTQTNAVGGFIGLISRTSQSGDNDLSFVNFENCFYTNTLYNSVGSNSPKHYLDATYISSSYDSVGKSNVSNVVKVLTNSNGSKQQVWPYSIREMYYENTAMQASYTVKETLNELYNDQSLTVASQHKNAATNKNVAGAAAGAVLNSPLRYSYEVSSSTIWDSVKSLFTYANLGSNEAQIKAYLAYYGVLYQEDDNQNFKKVTSYETADKTKSRYYFIDNINLTYADVVSRYNASSSDISYDEIRINGDNYNLLAIDSVEDVKLPNTIVINGIRISEISYNNTNTKFSDGNKTLKLSFSNSNVAELELPNGSKVMKIALQATWNEVERLYKIDYVELCIRYGIEYNSQDKIISFNKSGGSNSESTYVLNVSSKKVIFKSYLNSGYWSSATNFLLDNNYANAQKYLTNIEKPEIYTWEDFKYDKEDKSKFRPIGSNKTISVSTAEELALIAFATKEQVDWNGNKKFDSGEATTYSYEGYTIKLQNDIDLSGKYWVPIGSNSHPFKGTFDGNGYSIKYTTVNSNSLGSSVIHAGLFGCVENATIQNLTVEGGAIEGVYAGGIIALAKGNVTLSNVENQNIVTGNKVAAGLVSGASGTLKINDCINNAKINSLVRRTGIDSYVYAGGLVGCMSGTVEFGHYTSSEEIEKVSDDNLNYGDIYVLNNKTSYATGNMVVLRIGGVVGFATTISGEAISNYGDIDVTTNAHQVSVGGVIGYNQSSINKAKNYANIYVNYNNIKSSVKEGKSAFANIGGVFGYTNNETINCGNEGKINLSMNTASCAFVGVGGIAGQTKHNITYSYNSNDIAVSTISSKTTIGVGGLAGFANTTNGNRSIVNSYNTGNVSADSNATAFVGGIVGSANVILDGVYTVVPSYEDSVNSGNLKGNDGQVFIIKIQNTYNVGYISITAINNIRNGLGSISGISTNLQLLNNYYLKGSAYSANLLYSSTTYWSEENNGSYLVLQDKVAKTGNSELDSKIKDSDLLIPSDINTSRKPIGAREFLSSTLKKISGENSAGESVFNKDTWNFSTDWQQSYTTWYPSLKNNPSSALWVDKQELVNLEKGIYLVSTAEELAYLADKINSGLIDSTGIVIKLSRHIDLSNRYWTPIGTSLYPFSGTFDGQGYAINNLTIDGSKLGDNYLGQYNYGGLFGYTESAIIKNVGVESPIIKDVKHAGAIAVYANNTRIEKVYTDSENDGTNIGICVDKKAGVNGTVGAGGLVYLLTNSTPIEDNEVLSGIYNSYNNIRVLYNDESLTEAVIGGLVGIMYNSFISNSYNNSKGRVSIENSNAIVANPQDTDSILYNVFNLAGKIDSKGTLSDENIHIGFFEIKDETNLGTLISCLPKSDEDPIYDNLEGDEETKQAIWTKEYSLNSNGYRSYPSLRGLGKEWKNTESEPLTNYDYSQADSSNISAIEEIIVNDHLLNTSSNGSNGASYMKGHIKIANPETIYLTQTTSKKVYLIKTKEELAWLSTNVNNGSLDTKNCQFVLLEDIDLANRYWTPIGVSSIYPFQGVFNFNGHSISNLTIDADNLTYAGLFGYTTNAYITNGYVNNAFVKISNKDYKTNLFAGTIVGKAYNTTIANIRVSTSVIANSGAGAFVGGIAGSLTGTGDYKISNVVVVSSQSTKIDTSSYNTYIIEEITNTDNAVINETTEFDIAAISSGGSVYVGGVVGYLLGYAKEDGVTSYTLENATNNTNLVAVNKSNASNSYVGGIVGYGLEEVRINLVKQCGIIKAYSAQREAIGGIVGYLYNSELTNAYVSGEEGGNNFSYIEGTQTSHYWSDIGGIIGVMENESLLKYAVNDGKINYIAKQDQISSVGGIIGRSIDNNFINAGPAKYTRTETGFSRAVGIVFNSDGYNPQPGLIYPENEDGNSQDKIKFSDTNFIINNADGIDTSNWNTVNASLNLNHTYLIGGGTSFNYNEEGLSDKGLIVNYNSGIEVTIKESVNSAVIKIAYIDSNYNYHCEYASADVSGDNKFNLNNLIKGSTVPDDIIYIYVTLVQNFTGQ